MCAFLSPHEKGFPHGIIPTARFLLQLLAASERFDLSRDFVSQRAAYPTDRIHILNFDLGPELRLRFRPDRHVALTAQLPLFHVCLANPSITQAVLAGR